MDILHLANPQLMTILKIFLDRPSSEIIQSDIERETGFSRTTVIKWINFMHDEGFLYIRLIGRAKLLKLNNESSVIKELKRLRIILALQPLTAISKDNESEIYLFGSCARGDYVESSDIDVLIIGKAKRTEFVNILENIGKQIRRTINFKVFSPLEWSRLRIDDKPFYERVERDRVRIG